MLDTIYSQIQDLKDTEFTELKSWIYQTENPRRATLAATEAGKAEIVLELREEGKLDPPEAVTVEQATTTDTIPEWVDPGTSHALMYQHLDVVQHNGKIWQSQVTGLNHWEPGAPGVHDVVWRDVTRIVRGTDAAAGAGDATGGTGAPVAAMPVPYTDGRDYKAGDVVIYGGAVYECTGNHHAASGWTPVNAHAYWKKLS